MPFTTVGWSQSQITGNVLKSVNALADQHVTVSGADVKVPALNHLVAAYAIGATITLAQIQSPKIRSMMYADIGLLEVAAAPASPPAFQPRPLSPLPLSVGEKLDAYVAASAAVAEQDSVLAWLADAAVAPVTGEIYTVRCTSSTTCVAYAWTNGTLTFTQTLPVGNYQIVGARAESATLIAFRFVLTGYQWRPGGVGCTGAGKLGPSIQRYGGMGVWGAFSDESPPTVDFLAGAADASEVVYLDLIKSG